MAANALPEKLFTMPVNISEDYIKSIKVPGPHDDIHKDECVLSFDSPDSDSGIYISLSSFLAFGVDFYKLYYKKTNHGVFLHYKRTKKEIKKTDEEGPEKKITRLAIGVEGGFEADTGPKYTYTDHWRIVILPGPEVYAVDDPDLPAALRRSANGVMNEASIFKKAELELLQAQWDGEKRFVSKYAYDLVQTNDKKVPASGWKCEKCDLRGNLWLNLSDGSILCGRRNFDGSGGNNHALEHFQATKYPLAVKLGTIVWEEGGDVKGDVFSYNEDDLVVDPLLCLHLAHFGLNAKQLKKTELSMAELEIEMNQKIGEWGKCQETGQDLVNVYGPGRTGLINLGNTCYLNSVVQVLFSIPEFISCFVDDYPAMIEASDLRDPAIDFRIQMGKLGFGLCSGKYSQPPPDGTNQEQIGISPRMFKNCIARGHREFMTANQQDAQEFFLHLINLLEKNSRNRPNPANVFKFEVEDRTECIESKKVMYVERTEYCLALPLPLEAAVNKAEVEEYEKAKLDNPKLEIVRPRIPMHACIEALIKPELIDDFYSTALKKRTQAKKSTRLASFPKYLMVHMKKFAAGLDGTPIKLNVEVDAPDELDLEQIRGTGLKPGEEPLPDGEVPEVNLNEKVLQGLLDFGVPLEPAKKAVFFTKGVSCEVAYEWYEQHIGDVDLMAPFVPPGARPQKKGPKVNEDALATLVAMGFDQARAIKALQETGNNLDRATEWIFSHDDVPEDDDVTNTGSSRYRLRGFITHMGTSATVGHYVCHILLDGQWIIFNDNKVALSVRPPKELAYLYLYERCD